MVAHTISSEDEANTLIHASEIQTVFSQSQLPQMIAEAARNQSFHVRSYAIRQVAEHLASQAGREDIKFIVKRRSHG
jgi:hypothetical protein